MKKIRSGDRRRRSGEKLEAEAGGGEVEKYQKRRPEGGEELRKIWSRSGRGRRGSSKRRRLKKSRSSGRTVRAEDRINGTATPEIHLVSIWKVGVH